MLLCTLHTLVYTGQMRDFYDPMVTPDLSSEAEEFVSCYQCCFCHSYS